MQDLLPHLVQNIKAIMTILAISYALFSVPDMVAKTNLLISEHQRNGFWSMTWLTLRFMFGCFSCGTFWIALCGTHSFILAMNLSLAARFITK